MQIQVMPNISTILPGEKQGQYYVPQQFVMIPVGNQHQQLMTSRDDFKKHSFEDLEQKRVRVVWDGIEFFFYGPKFEGLPAAMNGLEQMKARFLLTSLGAPEDYAEKILNKAKSEGSADFYVSEEKPGKAMIVTNRLEHPDGARTVKTACDKIRSLALIKEAFAAQDEETVDSVLSLNFVTPQNMMEYVDSIDEFKGSMNKLAKLLVASRLGMQPVSPEAVKLAMSNMAQVVEELEVLRSTMGEERKKK
jgi:hypothetical protein